MPRVPELLADLFASPVRPDAGEIRPDSPRIRPEEIQQRRGFSPHSPDSPLPDPEEFARPLPAEPVDSFRPDSPRVRPSESPATTGVFAPFAPFAPGGDPPERPAVTADDLIALHGEIVANCRLVGVLKLADDGDLPDFLDDPDALAGFARALVADRLVRPLPDPGLPPLARLADEIGDDMNDLREYLDRTGPGRALRVRIEREAGACDRCLLALRANPTGGLLPVLLRALDGGYLGERPAHRHDDGRVQVPGGAWRTPEAHARIEEYDAHHWRCETCRRAGRGYGDRCADGERLHALTRNQK